MVRLLFLLLFGTLAATGIEGSGILWRATSGGFDYAFQDQVGRREVDTIKPSYHWGFWVAGHLTAPTGCHELQLYGLRLKGEDEAAQDNAIFINDVQEPAFVTAHLEEEYWTLRLRFSHTLCCGTANSIHLSAAVRYSKLKEQVSAAAVQLLRFQGAGPEIGFAADAKLWKELRFKGSLSTAALIGERRTTAGIVEFETETGLVPMIEARIGARAGKSFCWFCFEAELGWALDYYWGALGTLYGARLSSLDRELAGWGFTGPYATFRGSF